VCHNRKPITEGENVVAYETRLNQDRRWALREGSMHFERESAVHKALGKIVDRLQALGVPFAIADGMAMFLHGYRRFTEDVDILVTPADLKRIHEELEGRGYIPPFAGSKHWRDAENGVRVEFLTTGDFPGDGQPKPVAFPNPTAAAVIMDGMPCLSLAKLVELKLASGMTNAGRLKDHADVQQLIKVLALPEDFTQQLDPFVRDKYKDLWSGIHDNPDIT
jgi:hypothetical protein